MRRRKFLQHTAHSFAIPGVIGSFGFSMPKGKSLTSFLKYAQETDRVLVLIFLDGGNDGLNTVVPLSQMSNLNNVRPKVVLPDNSLHRLPGTDIGLHPSFTDLKELYKEGRFKIIQSVGYPNPDFSHFRSSDIWMSASDSDKYLNSGWAGRFLDEIHPEYPEAYPNETSPHPLAIEIGYGASLLFQGPEAQMGMVFSGPDSFYELVDNVEPEVPNNQAGDKLNYIRLIARQSQQYGEVVKEAAGKAQSKVPFPGNNDLAHQLKIVSRLIAGGLETPLYMVRIGGFDTHDAQVDPGDKTRGFHSYLLKSLNDAIIAFQLDLEKQGTADRVVGMTFSEFGRTIISNGSDGTDHGTAAPLFVFGNAVAGGVTGENPTIPRNATWEDDLTKKIDFRQVYASVLEQWFGIDHMIINRILGKEFETVNIIGESEVILNSDRTEEVSLSVYPNPLTSQSKLVFPGRGEYIEIQLWNMQGQLVKQLYKGTPRYFRNVVNWNTSDLSRGQYLVIYKSREKQEVFKVIK
jgi:uncharacterized protein (DUF1501 family)